MSVEPQTPLSDADRLAQLEARLARLEAHLGLPASAPPTDPAPGSAALTPPAVAAAAVDEELELEVGQNWFALVGIVALTAGAGLLLAFPYASLPAGVPPLLGYGIATAVGLAARRCRQSLETLAALLRGTALVLVGFATLRFCFPATHRAFDPQGIFGRGALLLAAAAIATLAARARSPWLPAIATAVAALLLLATGSTGLFLAGLIGLAILAATLARRHDWPWLPLAVLPCVVIPYFAWALGNPFFAAQLNFVAVSVAGPLALLGAVTVLALEPWRAEPAGEESVSAKLGALLQCGFGYGTYLVTTLAAFPRAFVALQVLASVVLIGLAAIAWHRRGSRVRTFFYAMTGYGALTTAILKFAPVPELFVWLSVQSVVVVATAIWFRSRLIVVANFGIYLAIVLGYVVTAGRETGISLGFGLVALVTAHILDWQKHRLTLATELMRNAYLLCAFAVFPYALAHLVPASLVVAAWVALAAVYYALHFVAPHRRYRWLGHGTLLLTSIYLVAVGTRGADPVYRTLSFLLLGAVLLTVSLAFTRARRKAAAASNAATPSGPTPAA